MANHGRQRPLESALVVPPSPDDLEAASGKYKRRKRRGEGVGSSLARSLRAAPGAAVWAAGYAVGGVLLGLLLTAAATHVIDTLAARAASALPSKQHPQAATTGALAPLAAVAKSASGSAANCTVRLADADRALLRREMESLSMSLCDPQPWLGGAADVPPAQARADVVAAGQVVAVEGTAVPRVVDAKFGPQSTENVPGVEDIHGEMRTYNDALVAGMAPSKAEAAARQQRIGAAQLGLSVLDGLNDTESIPHRIAFLNQLYQEVQEGESLRVCIAATVSADVVGVRRELLPWLQYHTELGAARFYLLYDGEDAEAVRLLSSIRHVTLLHIHPPFATAAELERFRWYGEGAGDATTRHWQGQPGNFGLMIKQGYALGEALRRAAEDSQHWLLHLDPDELFHPGGGAHSLTAVLARQPPHVPAVRFMNFEGQPEAGDLTNRIEQVTLFRVHKHFITPEAHYYRYKYKLGDSVAFLLLYANGKSAVRVDAPGVHQLGPHFFSGNPSDRWRTPDNLAGLWRDVVSDDSVVLHYAYSYEQDVSRKAHRSCPDSYLQAARQGDRAKVKECFVIDFDADAYMAAAAGPQAARDFFFERMVLNEGAQVRCSDPAKAEQQGWCNLHDIERFKYLMSKLGLYRRVHGPQLLLRQHERQIQRRLRQLGSADGVHEPAVIPVMAAVGAVKRGDASLVE